MKEIMKMGVEIKLKRGKQQRKSRTPKAGSLKKKKSWVNIQQNWKNKTQISNMRHERCATTD